MRGNIYKGEGQNVKDLKNHISKQGLYSGFTTNNMTKKLLEEKMGKPSIGRDND